MKLHLDGVEFLRHACEQNNVGSRDRFNVKRDLWLRITAVVHTALALVVGVAAQLMRGVTFVITGAICGDWKEVKFGLKDIPSALVQAVALPVLGIAIAVTPTKGYKLLKSFQNKLDIEGRSEHTNAPHPIPYRFDTNVSNRALRALSHFVRSVSAVPLCFVFNASSTLSDLTSLRPACILGVYQTVARTLTIIPLSFHGFIMKHDMYPVLGSGFNLATNVLVRV